MFLKALVHSGCAAAGAMAAKAQCMPRERLKSGKAVEQTDGQPLGRMGSACCRV
jgi:hypothetical protein